MAMREYLVGEVTEEYAEGLLSRREAVRRLSLLGVGLPGAAALVLLLWRYFPARKSAIALHADAPSPRSYGER